MMNRREIIGAAAAVGGAAVLGQIPGLGSKAFGQQPATEVSSPSSGNYVPVHTLNGVTLPFNLIDGVKVMHLVAEEVEHEFATGLKAHCWGYNGRTIGPTIEVVQGDHQVFGCVSTHETPLLVWEQGTLAVGPGRVQPVQPGHPQRTRPTTSRR